MKVSVIGTDYVGLVTATCFAFLGHDVCCLDINEERIDALNNGEIPIYEPGLDLVLEDCKKTNTFPKFTTNAKDAISHGDFVFIAHEAKAHKVYIESGMSYKEKTEVLGGLSEGDKVIVSGYNEVASGSKIQIKK